MERLKAEKAVVEARAMAAEKRAAALEAENEVARSTRMISNAAGSSCPYCDHLHQTQGHDTASSIGGCGDPADDDQGGPDDWPYDAI